jgi:hypothetical protein
MKSRIMSKTRNIALMKNTKNTYKILTRKTEEIISENYEMIARKYYRNIVLGYGVDSSGPE